ncbi:MAG: bifunctional hydroxymethylpyrimidine kinase/phosphomethylpyrimidine kinase [Deltaproteobacteria bacterium]|nr:bifunctional hydroxymethylpyrimidine kinase/phosphomethylpyrimidine kinase [Deltaproteobacteria bacterium]
MTRRGRVSALTIAGSDSGAGAGIQADLKTFAARRVYGASAITAITAQDTRAVHAVRVLPPALVRAQIDAVLDDLGADAVKTGMLGSAAVVAAVADALAAHRVRRLVVDPVLHASGGRALLGRGGTALLLRRLLPLAEVVTPNLAEASVLAGFPVRDLGAMEEAARCLVRAGARAAVVTGGHLAGDAVDVVLAEGRLVRLRAARVPGPTPHGTGCTFAAAIAAERAKGVPLVEAVRAAKRYVAACIRRARSVGHGRPVLGHLGFAP